MTQDMIDSAQGSSRGHVFSGVFAQSVYVNDLYRWRMGARSTFLNMNVVPISTVVITSVADVAGVPKPEGIVALDIEENILLADPEGYAVAISKLSFTPLVYSSFNGLNAIPAEIRPRLLWVAAWGSVAPALPWAAWQYANSQNVQGYEVDRSYIDDSLWEALRPADQLTDLAMYLEHFEQAPVSAPAPVPSPAPIPSPEPQRPTSYVVKSGDTLSGIAEKLGVNRDALYSENAAMLNVTARKYGRPNSMNGWWIYPGETLRIP